MIKRLIEQLAYDEITLSQALTRSKLIEKKIKNDTFKRWLTKETEGYQANDLDDMPACRKVTSPITLYAELQWQDNQHVPVSESNDMNDSERRFVTYHYILQPIDIIEAQILDFPGASASIPLPYEVVRMLAKRFTESLGDNGVIRQGARIVSKAQMQNVIGQTKQTLLDMLMKLDDEFPDLLDDKQKQQATMSKADSEKIQQIFNTNIHGNSNPVTIATGENANQTVSINLADNINEEDLRALGVADEEIKELKEIVASTDDKATIKDKITKWLGGVSAAVAGRGLYENLPRLIEFANSLIP